MTKPKKTSGKILDFAVPQEAIELQIEDWIRRVFESNAELTTSLKRIRDSYCGLLAGKTVNNADEILAEVRATLMKARKAKNVV
jgi:hypothetical protein